MPAGSVGAAASQRCSLNTHPTTGPPSSLVKAGETFINCLPIQQLESFTILNNKNKKRKNKKRNKKSLKIPEVCDIIYKSLEPSLVMGFIARQKC